MKAVPLPIRLLTSLAQCLSSTSAKGVPAPQRRSKNVIGFTMIELLVVMAILGILAALALPLSETMVRSQQERELKAALWEIRDAIDRYKQAVDEGAIGQSAGSLGSSHGYPPDLQSLVLGSDKTRSQGGDSGSGVDTPKLYFLRRLPRDPFADPALAADKTWEIRSYASPPDRFVGGGDVYDVRSTAKGTALDGTPYQTW